MRLSTLLLASAPSPTSCASAFFSPVAAATSFVPGASCSSSSIGSTRLLKKFKSVSGSQKHLRPRLLLPRWIRSSSAWTSPVASSNTSVTESTAAASSTEMAQNAETIGSVRQQLANLMRESLRTTLPELDDEEPIVSACNNAKHGDYQCNNAMSIFSKIKGKNTVFKNPNAIGQAIAKNIPESAMVERTSIAGPGFVNVVLKTNWIEEKIYHMLVNGVGTWAPVLSVTKAVVDFSSPNIAKEMHVGHLRSTIIGDSIANMLEFCHVDVMRRNHVGDWGTQFGMLIEYLFDQFPNWEDIGDQAIGDLQAFYKAAKVKFDEDNDFKARAQQAVVSLQGGDEQYRAAWKKICDVSRREFDQVYKRLKVTLEEKGESFYNPHIPDVVDQLRSKNLIVESKGAQVIRVDGYEIPLIVIKSDGGFNYATTDLTAFWYRINVERAEWIVYVTDVGQAQHFDMVFKALKLAGWLPSDARIPRAMHVGFGLVLGTDGKRFRTRSTKVVRLVDLLDEAKTRSKDELISRGKDNEWSEEELEAAAEALGYGAVKYADLKNNRLTNYTFDFDQMLDIRGNTAVYLLYAHARICSILRNSKKDIEELKKLNSIQLAHPSERVLGLHLVRFGEVVEDSVTNLLPNTLCEYLYSLAGLFTDFYTNCKVIDSNEETSRLLLCEATAVVMRACFKLLGITPLYRL